MESKRLWLHMPEDRAEEMSRLADKFNLSLSQFLAMTSWLGAQRLVEVMEMNVQTVQSIEPVLQLYHDVYNGDVTVSGEGNHT